MPSITKAFGTSSAGWARYAPIAALIAATLALYGPVWMEFATGPWRRDENAHALIIMAIAVGAAISRLQSETFDLDRTGFELAAGFLLLAIGLGLVVTGVGTETEFLSSASQGFVATGVVVATLGRRGLRRLWFPLVMTLYLIIWPGWALDALTGPMKSFVSSIVSDGLYAAGLPVAHAGAVISAGPYQLLVADACSGLNSLIALTAVGAVYLYAARREDWRVNALVLAALVPIAIAANILRVAALTLITYFLGYDAGQGFMHDGAGLLMFAVALGLVFVVDMIAARALLRKAQR